jgi:23S rRNA (adenine2503-C2)-methyltransferase
VRTPRGRDIMAACGQLKSASMKLAARNRVPAVTEAPAQG